MASLVVSDHPRGGWAAGGLVSSRGAAAAGAALVSPSDSFAASWGGCSERLAVQGLTAVLLIWDNASWHISHEVRTWLRQHNHHVKQTGRGVRFVVCQLPSKSPWLNPIEPKWVHGKRAIVEPDRLLSAPEIMERVYTYYGCAEESHRVISEKAA